MPAIGGCNTSQWWETCIYYHGGPVITSANVAAIYWSSKPIYNGGPAPGTSGPGSADGSLVGFFLNNIGGSQYHHVATTFTGLTDNITYTQYWASNTNVPNPNSPVSDAAIQAQITAGFTSGALTFDPNTVYFVFSDAGVNLGGNFLPVQGGYCGYHRHFIWNGNDVRYAVMPHDFDEHYDNFVCDFVGSSPNNDFAADAEVNVLSHELFEAITDPDSNAGAWYDNNGNEAGDKCNFYFGSTYSSANGATANVNIGGKDFLIQRMWANAFGVGPAGGECALGYLNAHISGPTQVEPYVVCTWTGGVDGGTPPYQASWESVSGPFSNTWSVTQSNANMTFSIFFVAEDSKGIKGSTSIDVTTNQFAPPCGS